eukprot:2873849-Prymnesium_polylepis.1
MGVAKVVVEMEVETVVDMVVVAREEEKVVARAEAARVVAGMAVVEMAVVRSIREGASNAPVPSVATWQVELRDTVERDPELNLVVRSRLAGWHGCGVRCKHLPQACGIRSGHFFAVAGA